VQGAEAPPAIVKALAALPRRAPLDVLLLVRGGGSLEDLWAFNDEAVARAIRGCPVPVITGVGHEVDVSIADFAADLRAATPTAAAELATPDIAEWAARLDSLDAQLLEALEWRLESAGERLQGLAARLQLLHPGRRLQDRVQRLDELDERLRHATAARLRVQRERFAAQAGRLQRNNPGLRLDGERRHLNSLANLLLNRMSRLLAERDARLLRTRGLLDSLNPEAVLKRGYAIVRGPDGRVLRDAADAQPGTTVEARLARGSLVAEIKASRDDGA
jgi:exodeoxyribonuclease VII large subunit